MLKSGHLPPHATFTSHRPSYTQAPRTHPTCTNADALLNVCNATRDRTAQTTCAAFAATWLAGLAVSARARSPRTAQRPVLRPVQRSVLFTHVLTLAFPGRSDSPSSVCVAPCAALPTTAPCVPASCSLALRAKRAKARAISASSLPFLPSLPLSSLSGNLRPQIGKSAAFGAARGPKGNLPASGKLPGDARQFHTIFPESPFSHPTNAPARLPASSVSVWSGPYTLL